ncbi:transcription elongation factor elongin A [Haematobia irritans]|uniref:transcription elongation factor elongin A n=1 Tax=Haematobia irritans TaxID=7368 RepID=UPI003F4FFDA0
MTTIVEVIQHYQRSIDNSQDNEARLLHCINKLYKLPIKVEHLQETGVGKTVNSLRKFNGEIGVAAKSLVTKWKAMVAAEEEPMDTTPHSYQNETNPDDHGDFEQSPHDDKNRDEDDDENLNHRNSGHSDKEKHKERSHSNGSSSTPHHKDSNNKHSSSSSSSKHSNDKHKSSSSSRDKEMHHKSSSSGSKDREKEKTEHKSKDKHKDKDQDKERNEKHREEKHKSEKESKREASSSHKHSSSSKSKSEEKSHHHHSSSKEKSEKEKSSKHKSSSKDKEHSKEEKTSSSSKDKSERKSSGSSTSHKSETSERKRRQNSDTESNDFKSPTPKVAKLQKESNPGKISPTEEDDNDDSFDSSMGTNFNDILGMLNMPTKKSKKTGKSSSTSTTSGNKDSPPKPSTSNRKNGLDTSSSISYSPMSSSSKPTTSKPDLLSSTAKLEPLDPSIALELPTISTNYRPMPLNQTVMDCVFNTSSSSSKPARTLTDAEALHHGISSKTMRTKIYSGSKTGQLFQVPTLFDMCIRILQKNIDALEYTGGVPFEVLRPVLERATPDQLYVFEDYNPYLMEDSDVLWQIHVSRKFRSQKRLENESWREMFLRCQEEEDRRLSILKDSIKQSQKIAAAPVRKTQLAFVDSMVKPPRNVMRKQEQFGTKSKLVATPAARVAALQTTTPNAAKSGDQRLKVAPTVRDHAQVSSSVVRNKKAPLMQKTLAFMRGRLKR